MPGMLRDLGRARRRGPGRRRRAGRRPSSGRLALVAAVGLDRRPAIAGRAGVGARGSALEAAAVAAASRCPASFSWSLAPDVLLDLLDQGEVAPGVVVDGLVRGPGVGRLGRRRGPIHRSRALALGGLRPREPEPAELGLGLVSVMWRVPSRRCFGSSRTGTVVGRARCQRPAPGAGPGARGAPRLSAGSTPLSSTPVAVASPCVSIIGLMLNGATPIDARDLRRPAP